MAKEKARTTDEIENENEQEICWLCGIPGADTIINVGRETPINIR